MKKLFLFILLLPFTILGQTHYVSADATGGGKGLTKTDSWTLQEAFSNAVAGNIVYIKAGNYGKKNGVVQNYVQNTNGSATQEICFIGCDTFWNPVTTPINQSTYTFDPNTESELNKPFSKNDMPYLNTGIKNGESAEGRFGFKDGIAITIKGDYVHLENIAIRGYHIGLWSEGDHGFYKNVNTDFMGDFRANSDKEIGINWYVEGFKNTIKNSFHRDSDMEGIIVTGDGNHYFENIEYRGSGDKNNDDVDYPIVVRTSNNTFKHIKVTININANHSQHGFSFKPFANEFVSGNGIATNNYVEDLYLENTRLEIQFGGAHHNLVKDVVLVNQGTYWKEALGHTNISLANGAHDNVIMNIVMYKPSFFVYHSDNDDGGTKFTDKEDVSNMGYNNTIINALVIKPYWGLLAFKGSSLEYGANPNAMPTNFRVFNSTIVGDNDNTDGGEFLYFQEEEYYLPRYHKRYPTGETTGGFYNCIFKDLAKTIFDHPFRPDYNNFNAKLSSTFEFKYINNYGGGADALYEPFEEANFSNEPVHFVKEMTSYLDTYNYNTTTEIIGKDYSSEFAKIATGFSPKLAAKFIESYKTNIINTPRKTAYRMGAY